MTVENTTTGTSFNVTTYYGGTNHHPLQDGITYYFAVVATDNAGNSNNTVTDASAIPYADITLTLDKEWNLISAPFIPNSTNITQVVNEISSNLNVVWYYDASSGTWTFYDGTGGATDTLSTFENGKGYWVKMNLDDTLNLAGKFSNVGNENGTIYNVYSGWNLIGAHIQDNTVTTSTYLANVPSGWALMSYDIDNTPTDTYLNSTDTMTRGYGYWLYSSGTGTIVPR